MSLTIKEDHGTFLLEGVINTTTLKQFKERLEFLLAYTNAVTINIDKVTSINKEGLKAIEDLFYTAKLNNKTFCVIGYGCKDIYEFIDLSGLEAA
ncbi:STAS domain-containing protein [Algibacter sp. PT7-4]|uniref:STAS domain-containing protein n=1 Tax=Algibacter ulvanivorans TaxID=3400999 RepID=UPI003AAA9C01